MNGCLTYKAEVDESLFTKNTDELDEIVSLKDGRVAIQGYDSIEVYINEDNSIQIHWYGFSYKDLPELEYFMNHRFSLPEEATLGSLENIQFRLQHKVSFISDVELSLDDENVQEFEFEGFSAYGILKDKQTKTFRLSSVEAPIDNLENLLSIYIDCADALGNRFTVTSFL